MNFEKVSKLFYSMIGNKLKYDPHTIIRENFLGKKF